MTEWVLANHFTQIMESLASGVLAVDASRRILLANRAACLHLGLAENDLPAGSHCSDTPIPEPFRTAIFDVMEKKQALTRREVLLTLDNGTRREIGFSASLLGTPEAFGGAVFLFVDMTERRALERAAEVNRQLAQVGELTAGVVHELRNPLMVIGGNAELLQRVIPPENPGRRNLDAILKETKVLERLVAQFLGFARPFEIEWSPCRAQSIVDRTIAVCQSAANAKSVALHSRVVPPGFVFMGDENKFPQVLINITGNAIDAVPQGGEVILAARREDSDAVFEITDNGPGIHLNPAEDIFRPFFSRKEGGTGLGLAICQRIVTAHKGTISFANRPEGGARFVVRLPLGMGDQS